MSIINDKNINIKDQKLFLGPTMGLQRYDQFKYPVFFDLFNKQREFIWNPRRNISCERPCGLRCVRTARKTYFYF